MRIVVTNRIHNSVDQTRAYAEYRVFAGLAPYSRFVSEAEVVLEAGGRNASQVVCAVRADMVSGEVVRVRARGRHAYDAIDRAANRIAGKLCERATDGLAQRASR